MPKTLPDNQRVSQRKAIKTRVVFEDEFSEGFLYFLSTDISSSGIFIESPISLQLGTKMLLKFSLYEGSPSIDVTGEVARLMEPKRKRGRKPKNQKVGIGIRFLGINPSYLKRIEDFIRS